MVKEADRRPQGMKAKAMDQGREAEGTSRVKSHTVPAKSRGATVAPLSRKTPLVPTHHAAGTPARKSASLNAGKKLPQRPQGRKG